MVNTSYFRQLCNDWGEFVDRSATWNGFPKQSSIVGVYETVGTHTTLQWPLPGGGSYRYALPTRHAILCAEMPSDLIAIHQSVLTLEDEERGAFTFWHAYTLNSEGRYWDRRDKAVFVCMSYEAFKELARRARNKVQHRLEKSIDRRPLGQVSSVTFD